jgi:hypothetical protein
MNWKEFFKNRKVIFVIIVLIFLSIAIILITQNQDYLRRKAEGRGTEITEEPPFPELPDLTPSTTIEEMTLADEKQACEEAGFVWDNCPSKLSIPNPETGAMEKLCTPGVCLNNT